MNTERPLQVKYWGVATPATPAALTPVRSRHKQLVFLLRPWYGKRSIVMFVSVCVYFCLCLFQSAAYLRSLPNFRARYLWLWFDSSQAALRYVMYFRFVKYKLPQIFSTYFTKNSMFRTYNTRTKEGLHIDFIRSSPGQRCIKYKEVYYGT